MKSKKQINKEMKAAIEDFHDLIRAACFKIKGKNPIYNEAIDEIYRNKSPGRNKNE